jgi:hypothetical protein
MKKILVLFCILSSLNVFAKQIIILSAALSREHFEFRKQQYIKAFTQLKKFGCKNFYVVEALAKRGPTFLDKHCKKVFYSQANDSTLRDKGLNEGITMLDGFRHFNFDPEDMIIKLTGRYCLLSNYFLKLARKKEKKFDAIVKMSGDYLHTQCFALRYKFFKEMLESFDYQALDRDHIIIETAIGNYIMEKAKEGKIKVCFVGKLHVGVDLYGSTTNPTEEHYEVEH